MKRILLLMLILFLAVPTVYAMEGDNIDLGGQVRLRGYTMQNFWDFDYQDDFDDYRMFRLKTSLNAKVKIDNNITGFIQLSNQTYGEAVTNKEAESKARLLAELKYYNPKWNKDPEKDWSKLTSQEQDTIVAELTDAFEADNVSNKVFVDNAYINVNSLFEMPISLRFGRQNLMYGSGFVLFDGQSQTASTSLYFDGVKLSVKLGEKAVLDGLYFKDQENNRSEDYFSGPPSESGDDITLSGAYLTGHCPVIGTEKKGQQELYALNRHDQSNKKNIWMYGLRLSDKFDFGLDYSCEFAYQTGDSGKRDSADIMMDQDAMGYKLQAGYTLDVVAKPRFFLGYASLEGDDPGTSDYEGWDVFYGGWPQFGDLLAWMFVNVNSSLLNNIAANNPGTSTVTGEAAYTNLNLATAGLSISIDKFSAEASYTMLTFDEDVDTNYAKGDDFGDYYQLKASYAYTKNLSFSMYAATIEPGDAFKDKGLNDEAYEFFWETSLRF